MASETELGVLLKPDTSELDQVEDREVNVPVKDDGTGAGQGSGGGGSAAAGGFAGAEAGELLGKNGIIFGVLAGILSQLKPVTQFLKLIFRVLSLSLLPAIQLLVTALRPLLKNLAGTTRAVENPGRTIGAALRQFEQDTGLGISQQTSLIQAGSSLSSGNIGGAAVELTTEAVQSIIDQKPNSSDLMDEGEKNQQANIIKDVLELIA